MKQVMENSLNVLCLLFVLIGLSSCQKETLVGNGQVITENRSIQSFEKIVLRGNSIVHLSKSDSYDIKVKAFANLLPSYLTQVNNKVLNVGYRENIQVQNDNTEVWIGFPELVDLEFLGNSSVRLVGTFPMKDQLSVSSTGNGQLVVTSPINVTGLTVRSTGSNTLKLADIRSLSASVSIEGSSVAYVHAAEDLTIKIQGNGKVYYMGAPELLLEMNGNGEVLRLPMRKQG